MVAVRIRNPFSIVATGHRSYDYDYERFLIARINGETGGTHGVTSLFDTNSIFVDRGFPSNAYELAEQMMPDRLLDAINLEERLKRQREEIAENKNQTELAREEHRIYEETVAARIAKIETQKRRDAKEWDRARNQINKQFAHHEKTRKETLDALREFDRNAIPAKDEKERINNAEISAINIEGRPVEIQCDIVLLILSHVLRTNRHVKVSDEAMGRLQSMGLVRKGKVADQWLLTDWGIARAQATGWLSGYAKILRDEEEMAKTLEEKQSYNRERCAHGSA